MWSPGGFEKSYHVQHGTQGELSEEVTVRVRLEPVGDSRRATFLTHTSQAGVIVQHYRYTDFSHSESYNGSYSAGVDYGAADQGEGQGIGLSSDRTRSYSGSVNRQGTRLQRIGLFNGLNRVQQEMTLVIEVERRPVRGGALPSRKKRVVDALRRRSRRTRPATYRATLVRRIPTGMMRPAGEDPGQPVTVADPREVELHPGHFPQALWEDPTRPTLLEVVTAQLTKMLGRAAVEERRPELVRRLSPGGLLTAFERMTGPAGEPVVRVSRQKFRNQGATVTIQARMSGFTVTGGPFDAEKGEVDRHADAQNVSVSRGRTVPVGESGSVSDDSLGLNGGARAGEQASDSVSDHRGARRERSMFEKGKAYSVRLRVDYDLTFQHVARLSDGNENPVGDPVRLSRAAGGEVDVVMFGEEIEELRSRMESNVRLAPPRTGDLRTFTFLPGPAAQGPIQVLQQARLEARERGQVARVAVTEAGGVHRYHAMPDGTLRSDTPDGGFADAFASLSPELLDAAHHTGLDLRRVFMESETPGTFSDQVRTELSARGALPVQNDPAWPAPSSSPHSAPVGGSVAQGVTPPSVPSHAMEGTPFARSGRPSGVPDLSQDELNAQNVTAHDLGGAAHHLTRNGDRLTIQLPAAPDHHVRLIVADPGDGLNAATDLRSGTRDDPSLVRVWRRVHPDLVSSVVVHELSHVAQAATAHASGRPQGVVRPAAEPVEGSDLCVVPRTDEHAHLAGKWRAATDPATRALL
ncbi:MAG: hypothetical protein HOY71_14280, partial [Nonomuraea sp.]|nr:hypothetical protein [Nonomuraea sp.]